MNFDGTIRLDAPAPRVWETLLDVNQVSRCIPGLVNAAQLDERTFEGTIEAVVGPISGRFTFRACITDSAAPSQLAARIEGTDSVTKSTVSGDTTVTLTSVDAWHTELSYRSVVNVRGRLAILGELVLRATAAVMLDEVAQRLRRQAEGGPAKTPRSMNF
jgi:carbon monoxide dehydrogenase subunit G